MFRGLYAIADRMSAVDALLAAGAPVIQVRWKDAGARDLLQLARLAAERCRAAGVVSIVNDRADVAALCGAVGVHLGQDDLPVQAARAVLGAGPLVGVSTHDLDQVDRALAAGADYLGFGPVFETHTKSQPDPVVGLEGLRAAVERAGAVPVVAIGGITLENVAEVASTGCAAAAVISDILGADDPQARARAIHQAFLEAAP